MRRPRRSSTPRWGKRSRLSLHVKIVLTDEHYNLSDLIRLGLTTHLLQGEDLRNSRPHKHTMTATTARFIESQRMKQSDQIVEGHVAHCTRKDTAE